MFHTIETGLVCLTVGFTVGIVFRNKIVTELSAATARLEATLQARLQAIEQAVKAKL